MHESQLRWVEERSALVICATVLFLTVVSFGCERNCVGWERSAIDSRIDRVEGILGISEEDGTIFINGTDRLGYKERLSVGSPLYGLDVTEEPILAVVGAMGVIRISPDSGASWISPDSPAVVADLLAVQFSCGKGLGISVGSSGTILKSTSDGATWIGVDSPTSATLRDVAVIDSAPRVAVAVGDGGTILRSDAEGELWSIVPSGTSSNLLAVDFLTGCDPVGNTNRTAGFAVGDSGVFLFSDDMGVSWRSVDLGFAGRLREARIRLYQDQIKCEFVEGESRIWQWQEDSGDLSLLGDFGEAILWYSNGQAGSRGGLFRYRTSKSCSEQ